MTEIKGKNSVLTAIDPNKLKEGAQDYDLTEQVHHNDKLKKFTHIFARKELSYVRSFTRTDEQERTLLHWRDLLVGLAMSLCTRSTLTYDQELSKLTNQALYLHKRFDISKFYDRRGERYKGLFSTISYLFNDSSFEYPIASLEGLLEQFWDYVGWDHDPNNYYDRHEDFLARLFDVDSADINSVLAEISQIEDELNRINDLETSSGDDRAILRSIRRNLLNPSDWDLLPLRLVLSEHEDALLDVLDRFNVTGLSDQWATKTHERILDLTAPYGTVGVYLALTAQGYINVARHITQLEERYRSLPLEEVYNNPELRRNQLQGIPERLLTALDSSSYLAKFGTIKEAGSLLRDTAKTTADFLEQEIPKSDYQLRRTFE